MSNVQSYNALIDRFKAFASGHFILKTFSHGQIDTADLEKFTEYPFMHVVPSNVTYAKGMKTFSFQIVLADLPRDKDDKVEFQREVLSDLQRIAEDLVAEITNHRVLFGDLITVQNVTLEPFLEEFHNTLTGWTVSLDLLVPYYWDACSIPAEWNDFFESSTGGTGSILTFIDSITRDENGNVSLVNDEATPSPNYYYGTDDEGVRGWYLLETGGGLTCETIGDCQTIIDIEAAIDALEEEILLKANTADISAVGFSNDYNDLDNKPTIPNAQVNSDWNATSGVAEILNKPTIPTATSDLTNDGEDGVNPFITAQDLPSLTGYVPYTGATQNVDLGTHTLSAKDLVINHSSGSGVAASITKGGAGEALTVNKTSGSGNAMSVTGGVTQLSELHLTTDLADAYIASAATWNAKVPETRTISTTAPLSGGGDLSANRTLSIAQANTSTDGYLSSTDWNTFNGKQAALGFTPENTANKQNSLAVDGTGVKFPTVDAVNTQSMIDKGKRMLSYFFDFIGPVATLDGLQTSVSGGNISHIAGGSIPQRTVNQQGVVFYTTSVLAVNYAYHINNSTVQLSLGGGVWNFETSINISVLSSVTDRYRTIHGFASIGANVNAVETDGVFFTYDEGGTLNGTAASPNWQCVTVANSVRTLTTTSTAVTAGAWHKLRIEINAAGTSVGFYLNGTLLATHTTNIPLFSNLRYVIMKQGMAKTAGITARTMFCDYIGYENILTTSR
jgi:hypothetical protein